ncbi:ABC transporter permease [Paenibacillus sp. P25]|nr:ABC transporter permease [Paenibacillus sp. P25]
MYFMILLLYFMIISYGGSVASAVAVEKGSRIKEVLITKVRPVQSLFGKVIGVGLAGLTQFLLIVLGAVLWFLLSGGQAVRIGGLSLDLSAVSGATLFYFVLFFLLGYFFYASLYAALGSLVSRAEEMNNATMPLSILVMLAFFAGMVALGYPDSVWTAVASYIPFFTPILMFVRVGMTDISPLAVVPPTLILLASVAGGCLLAAKIYSVGVLLYGQRPTMRAVWKAMTYR